MLRLEVSFQGHNSNEGEISSVVSLLLLFKLPPHVLHLFFSILKIEDVLPVEDFLHLDETYDTQVKTKVSTTDK